MDALWCHVINTDMRWCVVAEAMGRYIEVAQRRSSICEVEVLGKGIYPSDVTQVIL